MFNKELDSTFRNLFNTARENRHEFVTVEHLLLALVKTPDVATILKECGADLDVLCKHLSEFIDQNVTFLSKENADSVQPTSSFQKIVQRAIFHAQSSGKKEVRTVDILVGLFGENETHAVQLLNQQDITRLNVVNYIAHGDSKVMADADGSVTSDDPNGMGSQPKKNPLEQFATNLNQRARDGKIDPLIGREAEVERTIQILCRRRKNNPLFVGEAGVGKTAIAEGLAKKIIDCEVPDILQETTIYSLDLGALVAGTRFRGDFEERLKGVLTQIKKEPTAVLFIDEIHMLIGAGSASGGAMDASNLIKPMLASGELKCIGSTTYQEYRTVFEKDHALARRFQKIDIIEPSIEETYKILLGLKNNFEEHHEVKYTNKALHAAAELSSRYITERFLPDKAIDVIDEAGAYLRLKPAKTRKKSISVNDVESIIAKIARIPPKNVSSSDVQTLKTLEQDLKRVVFGQDDAIGALASAIKMSRSGLQEGNNPIGSFLFAGPTGVGKTEVTRQLAFTLGVELLRFDMSEYMEKHTVSRLIGAPPGYVGYDQGGLMTDAVLKAPHSVLLLDEIEKAHPAIFNVLLQVMDHGTLTDTNGRKVDFRHVILVMTTNAGIEEMNRNSIGFKAQDNSTDGMDIINRTFSPEFRNRLSGIIQFNSLDERTIANVVDKFIIQLETQIEKKKVTINVDDNARRWLAEKGYDPKMGARPMARVIQEHIKKPIAEDILFGRLSKGGEVRITVKDNKLFLDIPELVS